MATSLTPSLSEVVAGERIPEETLVYLRERLRNKLHQLVLREFLRQARTVGLKQKDLATRLGKRAEQITRWLRSPGNRTTDTVSDLLAAMGVVPRDFDIVSVAELVAAAETAERQPVGPAPAPGARPLSLVPRRPSQESGAATSPQSAPPQHATTSTGAVRELSPQGVQALTNRPEPVASVR